MDLPAPCDHRPTTGCENCLAYLREEERRHEFLRSHIHNTYEEKSRVALSKALLDPTQVEERQKEIFGDWDWERATQRHRSPPSPPAAPEETVNGLRLPTRTSPLRKLPSPDALTVTETVEGWPVARTNPNGPRRTSGDEGASTTPASRAELASSNQTRKNSGLDLDKINDTLRRLRTSGGSISRKSSTAQASADSSAPRTIYHKTAAGPSERRLELNRYRERVMGSNSISGGPHRSKQAVETSSQGEQEPREGASGVVHLSIREGPNENTKTTFNVHQMDSAIELCADVSTTKDNDGQSWNDDYNTFHAN